MKFTHFLDHTSKTRLVIGIALAVAVLVAAIAYTSVIFAVPSSTEAESGTKTAAITTVTDPSASGGSAVEFDSQ